MCNEVRAKQNKQTPWSESASELYRLLTIFRLISVSRRLEKCINIQRSAPQNDVSRF
jgi:hypothetical protein